MLAAAAAAAPAFGKDDPKLDAPPAGITPVTVPLSQILKNYETAAGKLAKGTADSRKEARTFSKAGLAGTETLERRGLGYHSRIVTGSVQDEYGRCSRLAPRRERRRITDGLIGQNVLRYFDVYFDYSREKMYLVPNDRYRERF